MSTDINIGEGLKIKATTLIEVKASQIVKNSTNLTLREVDRTSKEFDQLKRSIGTPKIREVTHPDGKLERVQVAPHGMLNPISIRPLPGEPGKYALVDGGHRHAVWSELFGDALPIPAYVVDLNEVQTMEAQIEANFHVKKTRPAEYTRQIKRLLETYPLRSIEEQADRLHMDPATLRQWFGLLNLKGTKFVTKKNNDGEEVEISAIAEAVDDGELPLSAAFVISTARDSVPEHQEFWNKKQDELFEAALAASKSRQPQAVAKFCMEATAAIKEIKKAFREQKNPNDVEVQTPPVSRKLGEMKIELSRQGEAVLTDRSNEDLQKQIADLAKAYPEALSAVRREGYFHGVQFALQVDEQTLVERKRQKEEQMQHAKEAREEKKAGSKATAIARSTGMFGKRL